MGYLARRVVEAVEARNGLPAIAASLAIPFAGMIQIRFNGYYLRLLATPAKTLFWLGEAGGAVKRTAR